VAEGTGRNLRFTAFAQVSDSADTGRRDRTDLDGDAVGTRWWE